MQQCRQSTVQPPLVMCIVVVVSSLSKQVMSLDSSLQRCYVTRAACRKEEGINTFNEISLVHGTTKCRLIADKSASPERWFGSQKSQQVGAFFKISSADAEKRRRKTKKCYY